MYLIVSSIFHLVSYISLIFSKFCFATSVSDAVHLYFRNELHLSSMVELEKKSGLQMV